MSFIAAAVIGAIGVGAGALISSNASHQASQAATTAATNNNALQEQIYNQNTSNIQPWMTRGNTAGAAQSALLGLGGDSAAAGNAFQNYLGSTDYTFQQNEARRATNAAFAARGDFRSGAAYKALQDRAQGIGAGYFQHYLDNLGGISQQGLGGANAIAGVGTNYAGAVGANNDSAASATGNAALSGASSTNALLGQTGSSLGYLYGQGQFGSSYGGSSGPGPGGAANPFMTAPW